MVAAEDAAPWGDAPDTLLQLIGGPRDCLEVAQETTDWGHDYPVADSQPVIEDPDYLKIAEELSAWFGDLHRQKGKNCKQIEQKVLKYS
jgi:hypothetical protein